MQKPKHAFLLKPPINSAPPLLGGLLPNSGSRDDTQAQVQKVWDELRAEV